MSVDGTILESGDEEFNVKALSVAHLQEIDFNKTDVKNNYLYFAYCVVGQVVSSGTVLFSKPKHFDFMTRNLKLASKVMRLPLSPKHMQSTLRFSIRQATGVFY